MLTVSRIDTWVATIDDCVGGLRDKLASLAMAHVDLELMIGRRASDNPNKALVFIAPVNEQEVRLVEEAGFHRSLSLHSLRVIGHNERGAAYLIAKAISDKALTMRGISAAVLDDRFVMYLAFDSESDATTAMERLSQPL
jgi:hypothetical protein